MERVSECEFGSGSQDDGRPKHADIVNDRQSCSKRFKTYMGCYILAMTAAIGRNTCPFKEVDRLFTAQILQAPKAWE